MVERGRHGVQRGVKLELEYRLVGFALRSLRMQGVERASGVIISHFFFTSSVLGNHHAEHE